MTRAASGGANSKEVASEEVSLLVLRHGDRRSSASRLRTRRRSAVRPNRRCAATGLRPRPSPSRSPGPIRRSTKSSRPTPSWSSWPAASASRKAGCGSRTAGAATGSSPACSTTSSTRSLRKSRSPSSWRRPAIPATIADHVGTQTRAGRSHVLLIGPSCTGMDHQGRVIWCADNDRQVMRLEKDGTHTVLSSGMNGQKFSGPNDIAIAADDAVYLADNDFGSARRGQESRQAAAKRHLPDQGRQDDARAQRRRSRRHAERHRAVARRQVDVSVHGRPSRSGVMPSIPTARWAHLRSLPKASASATARRPTRRAISTRAAAPAPGSSASRRPRASSSARSICRSTAASRRSRSVRRTRRSAVRMARRCSSRAAMPSTRSSSRRPGIVPANNVNK